MYNIFKTICTCLYLNVTQHLNLFILSQFYVIKYKIIKYKIIRKVFAVI